MYFSSLELKEGKFWAIASRTGLRELHYGSPKKGPLLSKGYEEGKSPILKKVEKQLAEYLRGERRDFSLPLELEGTVFQKKVWKALLSIPYGKTASYQAIAKKAGNIKASRAVGTANHVNPMAIVVPCHRVIAKDGTLGGYAVGLGWKKRLLSMESRQV